MRDEELMAEEMAEDVRSSKAEDKFLFEQLIVFGAFKQLPEDYWEKEGTGWK